MTSGFAEDVAAGLASRPKSVPPKHFYDELGSRLFDAICRLPWYTITRAELFAGRGVEEEPIRVLLSPFGEVDVTRAIAEAGGHIAGGQG